MIAFSSMLVPAAEKAGMKVPADVDEFDKEEFPHFKVFQTTQLGVALPYHGCHWHNAKIIAGLSEEEVKKVSLDELIALGLHFKHLANSIMP